MSSDSRPVTAETGAAPKSAAVPNTAGATKTVAVAALFGTPGSGTPQRPAASRPWRATRLRPLVINLLIAALCGAGILVTIATAPIPAYPLDIYNTLLGRTDEFDFAVLTIGLPRAVLAVAVGVGLAVAGALLQALLRNPLGSPDVVGFTSGATAGAVLALVLRQSASVTMLAAVAGGLLTAAVVFGLARGAGGGGVRLVVVGIGVAALLTGVNGYLVSRAELTLALDAQRWLTGSLGDASWQRCLIMIGALVLLLPIAAALRRPLQVMQLGDHTALALGLPLRWMQGAVVGVAVCLCAAAVTTAGPIPFVALAAPQIAARLLRRPPPSLLTAAAVGALLMVLADLAAQRVFRSVDLPIGIATGVVGGAYLAWLLAAMWRRT